MKRKLLLLFVIMSVAIGLTSCGDDDYNTQDYIVGNWALQTVNGLPPSQEIDYAFYGNYTGVITYNVGSLNQYSTPFEWETSYTPGGASYVTLYNYNSAPFRYIFRMESRQLPTHGTIWFLYLTDLDTGDILVFQEY